ncbi:MAG: Ig-like domain-containing protein [Clostridia bacterium]|nr:Ig-like domain-containing protein [Clostridia bacterium]
MKPKFSTRILAMVLMLALIVPTLVFNISAEDTTIQFNMGADGSATHADGSSKTTYTEEVGGYTLNITGGTKMYTGARDAKGNGCIKFGTSSAAGSCTITVPDEVTSVVIYVAAYKAKTATVTINDQATALTKKSDNGEYEAITVDTTATKTISFKVSSGYRAMLNTIEFKIAASDVPAEPSISIAGDNVVLVGDPITLTATPKNIEGNVVWTVDDETVATVADGVVTGLKMGTVTVTASIGEVSDSKEVTVLPAAGSKITIAEANAIAKIVGSAATPCHYTVIGTVESIDYEWSASDDNITVTVVDETGSIKAYKMKGGEGLAVGQKIAVSGKLKDYNGTNEFEYPEYELILDDTMEALLEALNALELKMSLAYKYTATVEEVAIPDTVTDTLDNAFTVNSPATTYSSWSDKTGASGAVYAGNSAGGNSAIQMRSNNSNSGIVTTASGGKIKSITITWNTNTSGGRKLNIYGKDSAYSAATELYSDDTQGALVTSFTYAAGTTKQTFTFTDEYTFIGIRSNSGALYLDSIEIEWDSGAESGETTEKVVYTDSNFAFRFAVDAALVDLDGIDACGIKITAGGKSVFFEADAGSWTKVLDDETGDELYCITVELGDIMNDPAKLGTVFTMQAYVEVDGVKYAADTEKAYSVADMVAYYYETLGIEQVEHLYEYLSANQLI